MIECNFKSTFGIDCLTCGAQRSFLLLLDGDLAGSFYMFPATIPFIITVLFTITHLVFKFKQGAPVIIGLFATTTAFVVVNYTLKIFSGTIYN